MDVGGAGGAGGARSDIDFSLVSALVFLAATDCRAELRRQAQGAHAPGDALPGMSGGVRAETPGGASPGARGDTYGDAHAGGRAVSQSVTFAVQWTDDVAPADRREVAAILGDPRHRVDVLALLRPPVLDARKRPAEGTEVEIRARWAAGETGSAGDLPLPAGDASARDAVVALAGALRVDGRGFGLVVGLDLLSALDRAAAYVAHICGYVPDDGPAGAVAAAWVAWRDRTGSAR